MSLVAKHQRDLMPKPGDTIHIPLKERDALRGLLAVKPTAEMPRPGASPIAKKKGRKRLTKGKSS